MPQHPRGQSAMHHLYGRSPRTHQRNHSSIQMLWLCHSFNMYLSMAVLSAPTRFRPRHLELPALPSTGEKSRQQQHSLCPLRCQRTPRRLLRTDRAVDPLLREGRASTVSLRLHQSQPRGKLFSVPALPDHLIRQSVHGHEH